MSRINTNTASLLAGRQLATSQSKLQQSLERLSSGLRINRGADDPAGLIISQNLQSEVEGVQQAINNSQRAVNVLATTEGALNEVANLLNDIQSKVVEAANTGAVSDDEIKANQLQIDSAVESITRIANTTSFGGRKLLNGSLGYVTSGINATNLTDVQLHGVTFGTANYVPVTVSVTQSAQHGELQFATSAVTQNVTIEIAGSRGVNTLSLLLAEGGFLYSSDSYADDLPYWVRGANDKPHLIIPYTLDANDMRFINPQGFENGDAFFAYLRDSFDVLYAEGERAPKMMSIGLHCRLVGRPGRAAGLIRFLDYVAGFDRVWIATRLDIAHHWYREHHALGATAWVVR